MPKHQEPTSTLLAYPKIANRNVTLIPFTKLQEEGIVTNSPPHKRRKIQTCTQATNYFTTKITVPDHGNSLCALNVQFQCDTSFPLAVLIYPTKDPQDDNWKWGTTRISFQDCVPEITT